MTDADADSTLDDHAFVVLAYRESPFLPGCLASLKAQTSRSRIVVATSTPCDHIARAAADAGAVLAVNPERRDIAGDWNFGLTRAQSARFVTLAHQDDIYQPTFLAETLEAFAGDEAVLCFTGYQEIDDDGAPRNSKISRVKHLIESVTLGERRWARGLRLRAFLSFGNPLPCSSVTFDRRRLSDFRFSDAFASNLDWDAWHRLIAHGHAFARSPKRLVGRRHNALTTTATHLKDGTRGREDLIMFRRLWPAPLGDAIAFVYRAGY
jgi:glycosyltransferase involved in cell wall biosynthesis